MRTLVCLFCGKLHDAKRRDKKTCSDACRVGLHRSIKDGDPPWSVQLPKLELSRVGARHWRGSTGKREVQLFPDPDGGWAMTCGDVVVSTDKRMGERQALAWARFMATKWLKEDSGE